VQTEFDLIVVGGGPAGYIGAIKAAQLGARVALVEGDRVGGTCLNRGCIPTKALMESARLSAQRSRFASLGLQTGETHFHLDAAIARKDKIVGDLVRGLEKTLGSYAIEIIPGTGKVLAPGKVGVGEQILTAPRILLATGSTVAVPPIPGIKTAGVVTSDEILDLKTLPGRLAIIGGGVIGVEMAGIFAALGSAVHVYEALPRVLPMTDPEAANAMTRALSHQGVQMSAGVAITGIEGEPGAMRLRMGDAVAEADLILVATGRRPRIDAADPLTDLKRTRSAIITNDHMQTSIPSIAAAGDIVADRPMLAHVAFHEAETAVENLLGHTRRMDYRAVPQCVFGLVDLAQVGQTEEEARQAGHTVKVGRFPMAANGRAMTLGETAGFVKVVSEERYGAVLGVHMVGPHASELLGEATMAVQMEATVHDLAEMMHMHPTISEAIGEAALDLLGGALHLPRSRKGTPTR